MTRPTGRARFDHLRESAGVIIVGAAAASLARELTVAGKRVWAAVIYDDLDLREQAERTLRVASWGDEAAAAFVRAAPVDWPLVLTGAMEHRGPWVRAAAAGRAVLGPAPETYGLWRDGARLRAAAIEAGLSPVEFWDRDGPPPWPVVIKPRRSAGGFGVRVVTPDRWRDEAGERDACVVQRWLEGEVLGAAYRVERGACELVMVTRNLVGEAYAPPRHAPLAGCGCVGPVPRSAAEDEALCRLGRALAEADPCDGVFGVDLIRVHATDDDASDATARRLIPIEVNPRWTGSMRTLSLLRPGWLLRPPAASPGAPGAPGAGAGGVGGERIVWHGGTRSRRVAGDLRERAGLEACRDVPAPGTLLRPGEPICTVTASGEDAGEVSATLARRAARVAEAVASMPRAWPRAAAAARWK